MGDHIMLQEADIRVEKVKVIDGCEALPGRLETQLAVDYMDRLLVEHPQWRPPVFDKETQTAIFDVDNESSKALYDNSDTLREWFIGASQAEATALYPLQRPHIDRLPSGEIIDEKSRAFFYHGLDAIGIRTRAKVMTEISSRFLHNRPAARWISLACGGAVPVMDALKECEDIDMIHLDLVDFNADALNFASDLATREAHLQEVPTYNKESELRSYTTHEINLIRGLIVTDSLVDQFGEGSSDMVDALGIFEYFSKKDSTAFLKNAYRLVRDDGVLVIANMLADRPQMEFNRRGVGWPDLYPRSTDELAEIIVDAGIDPQNVRIIIPEDGIYAVVEIRK
jgi:hypothetical protein